MLAAVKVVKSLRGDVRALIVGRPDQRVRPELILASILYLELNRDALFVGSPERDKSLAAMLSIYSKLFVQRADEFGEKQYHGAAFHLLMLAFYQMQNQVGGMPKVTAVESIQKVVFANPRLEYGRTVDILLEANGQKTIVELKSFKDSYVNKASHRIWKGTNTDKKAHVHKEFFTDVLHSHDKDEAKKMQWRFQTFVSKNKAARGPKASQIPPLVKHLCQAPTGFTDDPIKEKTGLTKTALENSCEQNSDVALQSMRTITRDFIKNGLFMQIDEDKLQELLSDLATE